MEADLITGDGVDGYGEDHPADALNCFRRSLKIPLVNGFPENIPLGVQHGLAEKGNPRDDLVEHPPDLHHVVISY